MSEQWLQAMEKAQPLRLLAAACPEGIPARVQLVGHLWLWAFAFDDSHFDGGVFTTDPGGACLMLRPLLRVLEAPYDSPDPRDTWATALHAVRDELERHASKAQIQRWAAAARDMLFSFVCEAAFLQCGRRPGIREYLALRMDSSGAKHHLLLIDFTHGYELSAAELCDPIVRAATEACCVILGIDNDLFSHGRERALERGHKINLVDIVAAERDASVEYAVAEMVTIRNNVLRTFCILRTQIRQGCGADLTHYADNLARWIQANLEWSARTARYQDYTSAAADALADLAPMPEPHRVAPGNGDPDIWWWQHLE